MFQQIRQTRSWVPAIAHLIDGIAIVSTAYIAQYFAGQPVHNSTWSTAVVAILTFFFCGELYGIYRGSRKMSSEMELGMVAATWICALAFTAIAGFFLGVSETYSRSSMAAWFATGCLSLMWLRMLMRSAMEFAFSYGVGTKRTAIAGAGDLGIHVAKNAAQYASSGFKIVGFYDDRDDDRRKKLPEDLPPFLGKIDDLLTAARAGEIDTVLITLPMRAENRIQHLLSQLGDTTTSVYIVPDFFVFELLHSRWTEFGGLPVVSVFETPIYGVDGWIKRIFDLAMASIAILILSPVLMTCALAVRLSSPGPVIFRQKRYGLDGQEILVWKFRSMVCCENGPVVTQATKNDPRVTKVGAFMRRTSLDELPQLFNVLFGTMSLVGPRPHASAHNEQFRKLIRGYMMRHKVRPGITGLAQVYGSRGETDTVEKMQHRIDFDHRYIREWSLWLDVRIIFRTLRVLWKHEAY